MCIHTTCPSCSASSSWCSSPRLGALWWFGSAVEDDRLRRPGLRCVGAEASWTISPGAGIEGSLSWRLSRTLDRRRLVDTEVRAWRASELEEEPFCMTSVSMAQCTAAQLSLRGDGSRCRLAFMVAAACREMEAERAGEPGGELAWPLEAIMRDLER